MTYPNNSNPDHQQPQTPPFWKALGDEDRETWQTLLTNEQRAQLANSSAPQVKHVLANRRAEAEPQAPGVAEPTPSPPPPALREETDEDKQLKAKIAHRSKSWKSETPQERLERPKAKQKQKPAKATETETQAKREALDRATTTADVLDALARITWAQQHDGEVCPPEHVPTEAYICAYSDLWPESRGRYMLGRPLREDLYGQPSPVCRHTVLGDVVAAAHPTKQWPGLNAGELAVGINGVHCRLAEEDHGSLPGLVGLGAWNQQAARSVHLGADVRTIDGDGLRDPQ